MEIFSQMLWPLLACFILVGIHAYLGIHVIARKVIFVDLALAQIAGLGAVYGVFLGLSFEADQWLIKIISVGFTLLGALLIAVTRDTDERIPHEAIIGIIYASALSITVLLTSNLPHGAEEVQEMLAGSILWVRPVEVIETAILYGVIGLVHIIFRRQFFELSNTLALQASITRTMKLWDFLFYATFGIVVTSSVGIGGVLLVFGYLVIPSVIGVLVADSLRAKLLVAWSSGLAMSVFGVILSYYADLPSGPCIVVLLSILLVLVSIGLRVKNFRFRKEAFLLILLGGFVTFSLMVMPFAMKRWFLHEPSAIEDYENQQGSRDAIKALLRAQNSAEILRGLNSIKADMGVELLAPVAALLSHAEADVRERAILLLAQMHWHSGLSDLARAFEQEPDDFIRLEIADAILSLGDKKGFLLLARLARNSVSELARMDALMRMHKWLPDIILKEQALIKLIELKNEKLEFDEKNSKYIIK